MFFFCAFGWLFLHPFTDPDWNSAAPGSPWKGIWGNVVMGRVVQSAMAFSFLNCEVPNISPPLASVPQHSQRSRRLPVGHFFQKSWRGHVTTVQMHVSHQKTPHFHQNQQTSDLPLRHAYQNHLTGPHFKILQSLSNPPIKGQGWKPHEGTSMQISLCNISRKAWSCPKRHNVGWVTCEDMFCLCFEAILELHILWKWCSLVNKTQWPKLEWVVYWS